MLRSRDASVASSGSARREPGVNVLRRGLRHRVRSAGAKQLGGRDFGRRVAGVELRVRKTYDFDTKPYDVRTLDPRWHCDEMRSSLRRLGRCGPDPKN